MGADLYIGSVYAASRGKWETRFAEAVKARDASKPGSAEFKRYHRRAFYCYDKMCGEGYFRDPYNDGDVLWKFGLSWWGDVIPRLGEDGALSVAEIQRLLEKLWECRETFWKNLELLDKDDRRYFERRAQALEKFLKLAIKLNEPIDCSL